MSNIHYTTFEVLLRCILKKCIPECKPIFTHNNHITCSLRHRMSEYRKVNTWARQSSSCGRGILHGPRSEKGLRGVPDRVEIVMEVQKEKVYAHEKMQSSLHDLTHLTEF